MQLLDPVVTLKRDCVFQEDEPATSLCILFSGKVQLHCEHKPIATRPSVKGPDTVGDFAVLHRQRHAYTATVWRQSNMCIQIYALSTRKLDMPILNVHCVRARSEAPMQAQSICEAAYADRAAVLQLLHVFGADARDIMSRNHTRHVELMSRLGKPLRHVLPSAASPTATTLRAGVFKGVHWREGDAAADNAATGGLDPGSWMAREVATGPASQPWASRQGPHAPSDCAWSGAQPARLLQKIGQLARAQDALQARMAARNAHRGRLACTEAPGQMGAGA